MDKEPALTIGVITAVVQAGIGMAVAFGLDLSEDQKQALILFVSAAFPIIIIMSGLIRQLVYSQSTVKQIRAASVKAGETDSPAPVVP